MKKFLYCADDLHLTTIRIDGILRCARPVKLPFIFRFWNAISVLIGESDAVKFYKQ